MWTNEHWPQPRKISSFPNAQVLHRSAYEINETDRFDMVFSIGVIHHLANPELAVANMVKAAKPGGKVLVWLYSYENNEWIVKYFNPMRKVLFSKMPLPFVHGLSLPFGWPAVVGYSGRNGKV